MNKSLTDFFTELHKPQLVSMMTNMDEWLRFTGIPGIPFTSAGSPAAGGTDRRSSSQALGEAARQTPIKNPCGRGLFFTPDTLLLAGEG